MGATVHIRVGWTKVCSATQKGASDRCNPGTASVQTLTFPRGLLRGLGAALMMYGENVPRGLAKNKQNLKNASFENRNSESKRNGFSCSGCNFFCKSFQNYKIHIQQTNHEDVEKLATQDPSALDKPENQKMNTTKNTGNKNMNTTRMPENQTMSTPSIPENEKIYSTRIHETKKIDTTKNPDNEKIIIKKNPGTLPEHIRRTIFCLTDYMHRTDREPLIGLEYVLEYKVRTKANNIEPKYVCELCNLETDVVPMVEHLTGFKHRKLYLAKEYPYVLKFPITNKGDRYSFVRRMALEIEREEGTKMYKIDNVVRMESTNAFTETNQAKRKTRWDIDGNKSQTRKNKALEYLESFEIENDSEAVTVTELASKLTAAIKLGSEKLKEEALFPVRVARAKDVAMSLMQNVSGARRTFQNPLQQKPLLNAPPQYNRGLLENNSMQVPQNPQQFPFCPPNPSVPGIAGSAQFSQNDYVQFLNKFMSLLKCLPQNTSSTENIQMNSQLMMLKSLLQDQTPNSGNLQQQMMMHIASLAQGTGNTDMGSLNQQLMMLMSSQNSTAMENPQLNQNALMQMAGMIQDTLNTGNVPMNQNFVSNLNQGVQNRQYGQTGSSPMMQMNQDAYQKPNLNTQSEYIGAPQNYGNFGYDRSVEGNYLSQADPFTRNDGFAESGIYRANEQTRTPYSEMSYESGMHGRKWNEPSYRNPSAQVAGTAREQAPYSRFSLSPNSMAPTSSTHEIYNSRQFDLPEWGDRENDMLQSKRARLDMDPFTPNYPEDYYRESRQPRGINPAVLSADVRDRIRGRDEFTVSAILSEYADNRPSK